MQFLSGVIFYRYTCILVIDFDYVCSVLVCIIVSC